MGTPPRPGQPRQDRRGPWACHDDDHLQRCRAAADPTSLRSVLEWLGLMEPESGRRQPVAAHRGGRPYGLVGPGYQQAEVVADRLAGGDATFVGADLSTRLKLLGVEVASVEM